MTKEEKQLLLKDLCARLPYGVKGLHRGQVHKLFTIDGRGVNNACIQVDGYDAWFSVDTFKPYLRPLSNMTEEEREEYNSFSLNEDWVSNPFASVPAFSVLDWLNARHFDYRDLIDEGLALEAPKDMYNEE